MTNESEWGMYYTRASAECKCQSDLRTQELENKYIEGWVAALGLHLLEDGN
jgi:hypothetical protein